MSASHLTPESWAEARRLRAEGASLAAIAKRLGIARSTLGYRAHKEDWPSPARAPAPDAPSPRRLPRLPASAATSVVRRSLVRRLYRVMDTKLKLMELRMHKQLQDTQQDKETDIPPTDDDREMRQLGALIKTIDQVTELEADASPAGGRARSGDAEARASEADAFRREIAERIEKLIPPS
jgi:transposase-like protein